MMKTILQPEADTYLLNTPFLMKFSFDRVIVELEKMAADPESERAGHAQSLLQEISLHPALRSGITDPAQVEQNAALIRRMLADYFPPALTKNEIKAISIPYLRSIFNKTERFQKILDAAGHGFEFNIRDFDEHQFYVMNCCLILNAYYGTQLDFTRPLFYDIPTAEGVTKHYRILYNADFLEILPTDKAVRLSPEDIHLLMNSYDNLALWKEKFPKESWILKGFAIMTLIDVTIENAVSILKEKLLKMDTSGFKNSFESILRSIFRITDIRVGFTFYNQEEDTFSLNELGQQMPSFILPGVNLEGESGVLCTSSYRSLVEERQYFAVSDTAAYLSQNPESCLSSHFLSQGFRSFILAPVIRNEQTMGVLEVVSTRPGELNSINANKLDVVMPYLTDTIERNLAELQNQVQAVIQEKYTAIHPSVQWKFRAEAQKLIYHRLWGQAYTLKEVVLPEVYPLYGQVDIKGSSEARNKCVQQDLVKQLKELLFVLKERDHQSFTAQFQEEVQQINTFLDDISLLYTSGAEQYISNYINSRIHYRLEQAAAPELLPLIGKYFRDNDKDTGAFHANRRKYENTISLINENMAAIIDRRQAEAQAIFPHYYERYKTDGVEHNLFIGPSIAPKQKFDREKLQALRLWQLRVLCEMEQAHHHLKKDLPFPLDVTTLLMVYDAPIALRFRIDEKRFDIDGSYSAQFEIVKKRIDKAHIKGTSERITQAGKVAIIYSMDIEEQEYKKYIRLLHRQGILGDAVETLEVEELQGVAGLKAMRVNIIHPS